MKDNDPCVVVPVVPLPLALRVASNPGALESQLVASHCVNDRGRIRRLRFRSRCVVGLFYVEVERRYKGTTIVRLADDDLLSTRTVWMWVYILGKGNGCDCGPGRIFGDTGIGTNIGGGIATHDGNK